MKFIKQYYSAKIFILAFLICFFISDFYITQVSAAELTSIMGETVGTKEQMVQYYKDNSPNEYPKEYLNGDVDLEKFIDIVIKESKSEGVRADVAFAQILVKTEWLSFDGEVNPEQYNFGELRNQQGNYASFKSIQEGIKADIQHLKAYASEESLNQECVDPIYNLVEPKGTALYVEDLENGDKIKDKLLQIINTDIVMQSEETLPTENNTPISTEDVESAIPTEKEEVLSKDITQTENIEKNTSTTDSEQKTISTSTQPTVINSFSIKGSNYAGEGHTLIASGTSHNGVLYQFWVKDLSKNSWTMIQDYSTDNTATWTPKKDGKYLYGVHIKDRESKERLDAHLYKEVTIQPVKVTLDLLTIDGSGYVGSTHTIRAKGTSANGVLYQFWVKDLSTNSWTMIHDYSKSAAQWTPKKPGKYLYGVHIKDKYSKEKLDAHLYKEITIDAANINSFSIKGNNYAGEGHTLIASGTSHNGVLYQFWVKDLSKNSWTMIQDYSTDNTATWTPKKDGKYLYGVHIKDRESKERLDAHLYKEVTIQPVKVTLDLLTIDGSGYVGSTHTIRAKGTSANGVLYQFWVKDLSTNSWTMIHDYSKSAAQWTPKKPGKYLYGVHIKDKYSKEKLDTHLYKEITINSSIVYYNNYYNDTFNEFVNKQMSQGIPIGYYGGPATRQEVEDYSNPNNFVQLPHIEGANKVIITGYGVNLRNTPGDGKVLDQVNMNEIYLILDESNGWYKIDVNGQTGWVSGDYAKGLYSLTHFLQVTGDNVRVRSERNLEDSSNILTHVNTGETYTIEDELGVWYKITANGYTGWIHNSNVIVDETIPEMLQFLNLSSEINIDVNVLNEYLKGMGTLQGQAQAFIDASNKYDINVAYLIAHAIHETGKGTSDLSSGKLKVDGKPIYNFFGISAFDHSPDESGSNKAAEMGWYDPYSAIMGGTKWISEHYIHNTSYKQNTLYKMKWNPDAPATHQYATHVIWPEKIAKYMSEIYELSNDYVLIFDIPRYES